MTGEWFTVRGLVKRFEGVTALSGFTCLVRPGDVIGLIGPNGAGKTTLFNVITGFIPPDEGMVTFRGTNLIGLPPFRITSMGIARIFQELRLIGSMTVLDNALLAFRNQPGERLTSLFLQWKASRYAETENREKAILLLKEVGLQDKLDDYAKDLSYGQQKLLSLVCCLTANADLLLLDEPVAGIAPEMIDVVLSTILSLPGEGKSVIVIEHNLDAVMHICQRVIFMDGGAIVSEGTPDEVRADPKVIDAYLT